MNTFEKILSVLITIFVITGAFQLYLIPQKIQFRKNISIHSFIDDKIKFLPYWVWIYTLLYYPFFFSVILTLKDFKHYAYVIFSFSILLILQTAIALFLPVKTPDEWREFDPETSLSTKFLSKLQSIDSGGNCFPSMHVAMVSLSVCHIWSNAAAWLGAWFLVVIAAAILICASTVFTKQHFVLDIPAGAALGGFVYWIFLQVY